MTSVVLALGLDGFARWVLGLFAGLLVVRLLVVLIVVGTAAAIFSGGHADSTSAAGSVGAVQTHVNALAPAAEPAPAPVPEPAPATNLAGRIIQLADGWLGVPYVFGGCSRTGVDYSCLVQNIYAAVGIQLPRVAVDQFNATIPIGDPRPGDLVFFANTYEPGISHVGIYIGDGLQINAPTPGQVVSVAPVFTGYWGAHYAGARRAPGR